MQTHFKMAQASLSRYICQNCRNLARVTYLPGVHVARVNTFLSGYKTIPQHSGYIQQVRWMAYQRPNQQPGLIGKFIENVRQGLSRNKEMQENIKKFKQEADKFEKSDTFQTAQNRLSVLNKVKDKVDVATTKISSTVRSMSAAASTKVSKTYEDATSSEFFKKGREVSDELSKSAKDAASKVQEQGEELGKTEAFKSFSTGFKVVKEEILDEEIEKSKPYQRPEKLRRRTAEPLGDEEAIKKERRIEANEDATGMVLHKDSKWYQQWKEFKDSNPLVNGIFSLKMKYDESDNVMIRATRIVTDKVSDIFRDVFSQSEMAKTLAEITKIDPQFNKDRFIHECEFEIIPSVLEAFLKGNLEVLKDWCHEAAYNVLAAHIDQTKQLGQRLEAKVLDIRDVDLALAKIMEQGPVLVLTFVAQQVMVLRDVHGKVVEGGEDNIEMVNYVWALCRDQSILDHRSAWRVLEFGIQNSSAWV